MSLIEEAEASSDGWPQGEDAVDTGDAHPQNQPVDQSWLQSAQRVAEQDEDEAYLQEYKRQLRHEEEGEAAEGVDGDRAAYPTARSYDSGWDENRTETTGTAIDGGDEGAGSAWGDAGSWWDCWQQQPQLPPIEAEDLVRAGRQGPDKLAKTGDQRPRRLAVCHTLELAGSMASADVSSLLRQDSGSPPMGSVLIAKYYDTHDRLGLFDGHEGGHLGDQRLNLEPGSQFVDLCASSRYQLVYLVDQAASRLYGVNLAGKLVFTVAKRMSAPQAACIDDRNSLLFVCQRRKVRIFQVLQSDNRGRSQRLHHRYLRSIKSASFRNLTSASALDGRLWLADSQADAVHLHAAGGTDIDLVHSITVQNPLSVCLDASGSAFVASGEPLHHVSVYGPDGSPTGTFGGWGSKKSSMQLPLSVCAYQLSHLVDKRMVAVCCFGEHSIRMHSLKNLDTSVI